MNLKELQKDVYENAIAHGWWDKEKTFGEVIALMHTELSEAFEEWRNGHAPNEMYYSEGGKPEGIPSELADVIIRILDFCGHHKIDIEEAVLIKHNYNKSRPFKHGGKKL